MNIGLATSWPEGLWCLFSHCLATYVVGSIIRACAFSSLGWWELPRAFVTVDWFGCYCGPKPFRTSCRKLGSKAERSLREFGNFVARSSFGMSVSAHRPFVYSGDLLLVRLLLCVSMGEGWRARFDLAHYGNLHPTWIPIHLASYRLGF